ncbi:MAG: hypothetical protein SR1Q5_08075, partial [Quinella sp. 1Q5]|nr:hypothetical protein [Quinella sp. 1Q5]
TIEGATINALGGNDSIYNGYYNDGTISNNVLNVIINSGIGDDTIDNTGNSVTIDAGADNDYIDNKSRWNSETQTYEGANNVSINAGAGNDYISNWNGSQVTINAGAGNDGIDNSGDSVTIDAGDGDDTVSNGGDNVTIDVGTGNDYISNWGSNVTIDVGADNDYISNSGDLVTIDAGDGDDTVSNGGDLVTIDAGAGNDLISLQTSAKNNLIEYSSGDGNDTIYSFKKNSTLSISGGTYSTIKSDDNIIVTVGDGKISLIGAASLSAVHIDGKETAKNEWKLSGTTATYGTSNNTLIKITNVKSLNGISLSGKVITVAKASVNAKKITLTGDGYTLALAEDVTAPTTKKAAWSYSGGTATYKSSYKTAGYLLASNAKSISYTKATTASTLATVKGVKSKDGLSLSGKVIAVAKASVNAKKITLTGDGYTLKLANDVIAPTTKKAAWSYSGGTATYKSSYKTAGYTLASNAKSISYTKATTASTLASVKGAVSKTGLSVNGKKITLKKSALSSKVTVSGGDYEFDFASDYSTATIVGSSKADTITVRGKKVSINAGKGDDTINIFGTTMSVNGGAGADTFVYKSGKHVIRDYKEEDKISITSGTATVTTSGNNVIFTVGSGKITVTGGKGKTVSYVDGTGEHIYPTQSNQPVIIDGKKITLTENYLDATFNVADYGAALQMIDASAAPLDIEITGNKLMNSIRGGDGNDTLIGSKGNDTLTGVNGADVFVWHKGDGNDLITDYTDEDTILINGDTVKTKKASGDNLIFTLASKNKITIQGGAYKIIDYIDDTGEHIYSHFVTYKDDGTSAKLKSGYSKKSFEPSDYAKYADDLKTINASAVSHAMSIVGSDIANSIMGTADEDYINGDAGKDTIRSGDGNDSILGGAGNDYLYGGEGNDSLWGGTGNDYLYGGEGENVFLYKPGDSKDRIFEYNPAFDTIKLLSGQVDNVESAGTDIVFTIGTGKIILDNAAGSYAKVVDSNGNTLKEYFPKTRS